MSYNSKLAQTGKRVANARRKYYGSFDYGSGIDARLRGGTFSFSRKYAWGGPDGKTWIPEIDETEVDEPDVQAMIAKYFRKHPNDAWKFGKDPETGLDYGAGFEGMSSGGTNWGGLATLGLGMIGSGIQSYNSMENKSNALNQRYDVFGTNEFSGLTDNNALLSTMANTPMLSDATAKDFRDKTVGQDIMSALSTGVNATVASGGNYLVGLGAAALDTGKSIWERFDANNRAKEASLEAKRKNHQFLKDMSMASQDVDARNDWIRMLGYYNDPYLAAFGGPLHSNGGDYNGGLTYINEGGRHEENPYEGVPSGFDEEGNPNLVEEGEVIWNNDYVFSDRLEIPEELAKKYKLGGKKYTFAEAIEKLTKENTISPNDFITIATTKEIVNEFMDAQETIRGENQLAAREEFEAAQAQDFLAQLNAAQGIAPSMGASINMGQMGTGMPNEAPVTEGEMMPPGYALGGNINRSNDSGKKNLFYKGGRPHVTRVKIDATKGRQRAYFPSIYPFSYGPGPRWYEVYPSAEGNHYEIFGTLNGRLLDLNGEKTMGEFPVPYADYLAYNDSISDSGDTHNSSESTSTVGDSYSSSSSSASSGVVSSGSTSGIMPEINSWESLYSALEGYNGSLGKSAVDGKYAIDRNSAYWKNRTAKDIEGDEAYGKFSDWIKGHSDDPNVRKYFEYLDKRINKSKGAKTLLKYDKDGKVIGLADDWKTTFDERRNDGDLGVYHINPSNLDFLSSEAPNAGTSESTEPFSDIKSTVGKAIVGLIKDGVLTAPTIHSGKTTETGTTTQTTNTTPPPAEPRFNYRDTYLRYAPAIGSSMAALYGMLNRPDYSNADRVIDAAYRMGTPINIPIETIGDYRRRNPYDERYLVNMANQNRLAAARGIANTAGGNRAMDLLGNMSLAHNNQQELGEIMRQAYLANRQDDAQVAEFNRGTNVYNMNAINQRNLSQAQLNSHRQQASLSGLAQGYGMRQAIKDNWDASTMQSLNSTLASLGAIGKENEEYNILMSMAENGYFPYYYGDRSIMKYNPYTGEKLVKNGGKLNRKKRRF